MIEQLVDALKTLVPVGGGLWAFYLYIDQKRERNREEAKDAMRRTATQSFESRRPFLELKLKTYIEIAEIVGELASEPIASDGWKAAEKRFWAFYWSQLSVVESKEIEDIMVELGEHVKRCRTTPDEETTDGLKDKSYDLAHQLRREIESDWQTAPVIQTSPVIDGQKRLLSVT